MKTKQVVGYLFIALAALLVISVLMQIGQLFQAIGMFLGLFGGTPGIYEVGYTLGTVFFWVVYFAVTTALWITGRRWIKKPVSTETTAS